MPSGRAWLASLGPELTRQREAVGALLDFCENSSLVASLSVGCSLGRGAADVLSDVDAAIGVRVPSGSSGAEDVGKVEEEVVALLPRIGNLVDALRQGTGTAERPLFAQFADRLQLDLAVVPEQDIRRGAAAPDFVVLHAAGPCPARTHTRSAYDVGAAQVREWSFQGWVALLDADKYLRRGSVWEAHNRLHEARDRMWALWAAALGAAYPWHGLSQVLDDAPGDLPPGIESTVASLDPADLRSALVAAADVLERCSGRGGTRHGSDDSDVALRPRPARRR